MSETESPTLEPVDAYLELVAEKGFDAVGMTHVAERSGLSLSELRGRFATPFDILSAFAERIDREVLDTVPPELMEDAPRERLFDVLMMRFDALSPYKPALKALYEGMERNPLALAAWNRIAVRSQYWMMIAAGLDAEGTAGMGRAQGLVLVFARTFRVWLTDEDPGMARTMAELDRRLREGERMMRRFDGLSRLMEPLSFLMRGRRRYPTPGDSDAAAYPDDAGRAA